MVGMLAALILSPIPWNTDEVPGLPTTPPPLPTYVVQNDGTRLDCTPGYTVCWKEQN